MKLKCFLIITLYFLLTESLAQNFATGDEDTEWSEGEVTLTSKQTLKGVVRYNSRTGYLAFKSVDDSKTLTPRSVVSFEYFDGVRGVKRKFYSLEVEDAKGVLRPQFFEVLKELNKFALIATENPMELKKKTYWDPYYSSLFGGNGGHVNKTTASQIEILYLIDMGGDINPYLIITSEEMPKTFAMNDTKTKVKTKIVGDELLKTLTAPHYAKLKSYAKDSKLSFDDKVELLKILDHYKELEGAQ